MAETDLALGSGPTGAVQDHRNPEVVLSFEVGIPGDIDDFNITAKPLCRPLD